MLMVIYVPMYRGSAGDPPDGSGAEGGGGAGGDVRVVLGVQLVIDGVLQAESPGGVQQGARQGLWTKSPSVGLCPGGLVQLGQDSFAYICIALLFGTIWLFSCNRVHLAGGGWCLAAVGQGQHRGD